MVLLRIRSWRGPKLRTLPRKAGFEHWPESLWKLGLDETDGQRMQIALVLSTLVFVRYDLVLFRVNSGHVSLVHTAVSTLVAA